MKGMMQITAVAAFLALIAGAPVSADDYYWNNLDEGDFGDAANWNEGESGVPDNDDIAIFDTESVHTVYFWTDHTTDRLLLRSGDVTFIAFGPNTPHTYTLLNTLQSTPSLVIGRGGRDLVWLTMNHCGLDAANTTIGHLPDATGRVMLSGSDTSLQTDQHLIIGNQGFGAVEAQTGATITGGTGVLGLAAGSYGEVLAGGLGTQLTCDGPLTIGKSGEGVMTIDDEAAVSCHDAIIGQQEDSAGAVSLSGAAHWSINGTLDVGMTGHGSLDITGGSIVTNHTFATIGTYDSWPYGNGGVGQVTVDYYGSPSWIIDGDLYIGFVGEGTLSILGGYSGTGSVIAGGDVSIGVGGPGTLMLSRGGTITIGGSLLLSEWNYDRLVIELGDSDDYPDPAIDAAGSVGDCEPEVILNDAYEPQAGDTFAIAHADGGLDEVSFILPELPGGLAWQVIQDEHDVNLTVIASPEGDINDDGVVNTTDLLLLLAAWGECAGCPEDINGDGVVNTTDLLTLLANWTG